MLLPENTPYATITDYIENEYDFMDESIFTRYVCPDTFRPVFVKDSKAYFMEKAVDINAVINAYQEVFEKRFLESAKKPLSSETEQAIKQVMEEIFKDET
jgi:hypothetical protein